MSETDIQNCAAMLKKYGFKERCIVGDDEQNYPTTKTYWSANLPKALYCIRGGNRHYNNAVEMGQYFAELGCKTMISFTDLTAITDEMIAEVNGDGMDMLYSEVTTDTVESFYSGGWFDVFQFIASSYVRLLPYIQAKMDS